MIVCFSSNEMGMSFEKIASSDHVMGVSGGIVHGSGSIGVICDYCPFVSGNVAHATPSKHVVGIGAIGHINVALDPRW